MKNMITGKQNHVKEFLKKGYRINERMKAKIQAVKNIRESASCIAGIDYSKDKIQSSKGSSDAGFVNIVAQIVELEESIEKSLSDLECIRYAIQNLKEPREKAILTLRYINFKTWNEICDELHVSLRTVHRIHAVALENMANLDMFQKEGVTN